MGKVQKTCREHIEKSRNANAETTRSDHANHCFRAFPVPSLTSRSSEKGNSFFWRAPFEPVQMPLKASLKLFHCPCVGPLKDTFKGPIKEPVKGPLKDPKKGNKDVRSKVGYSSKNNVTVFIN